METKRVMEIGELEGLRAAKLSWAQICRLMFIRWLYRTRAADELRVKSEE